MTNEEFIQSISLKGEEWREIPNWERYAVSNYGRIVSLGIPYIQAGIPRTRKPQIIKPRSNKNSTPYLSVVLSDGNGIHKGLLVHRIVASAFIPNPQSLPFINHKDENTFNNRVDNLEWCTQQYNCNYGTHNKRMARTISTTAYQKRKVVQLSLDNRYIATFDSIKDAALAIGISRSSVSLCCRNLKPSLCGHKWMYLTDYETLNSK